MDGYIRFADALVDRLIGTSIQAVVLIGAVWLLCRWLPRWSPAMRCLLWWLVGLQLMLGLALGRPLELPLLAPPGDSTALSGEVPGAHGIAIHTTYTSDVWATPAAMPMASRSELPPKLWPWRETLAGLWLLAMAMQAFAAWREWRETRAVIRAAVPIEDAALRAQCAEQARELGLRRCPELRQSDVIVSPQVAGLWRPVVLLPAERTLDPDECAMALAHELAHLRRGDLWLGWIPALAQRAFFFHPFARWAMREYAFHREAACDAQVLDRARAEPQDYGRLLLRLGVAFPVASGLAGASPTFQNLKRRLTLLQQTDRVSPRLGAWLLVALVALAGALPYRVTARASEATAHADGSVIANPSPELPAVAASAPLPTAKPAAEPAPAPAAKDAVQPAPAVAVRPMPVAAAKPAPAAPPPAPMVPPAPAAIPPAPPAPSAPNATPPPPPPAPPSPPSPVRIGHTTRVDMDIEPDRPRAFAIVEPDFITLQGSESDLATARSLQNDKEPLLWIRRGEDGYVVRDRAMLQRFKDVYAPMRDMAGQQGRLAGLQGELAGRQSGLASRLSALSLRRVELDGERTALAHERQNLQRAQRDTAEEAAVAASFQGRVQAIDEQLADLARQQADIDREQADFNRHQAELSRQQAELSGHQRDISRQVDRQMDRLIDQAVADGTAQPRKSR